MTFLDFWTNDNNPKLDNYLFGTRHIIMLIVAIGLAVSLSILFKNKEQKQKNFVMYILTSILIFFEITSRIVNLIIEDNMNIERFFKIMLPLHICSVMVWLLIIAVLTKKQVLINFSVIGGLLATVAFLLYPAVGINRTYMSFTCLYSTISHIVGFVCAILLINLGYAKFDIKKIWQPFLCFCIMFLWGALANFVFFPGSDYMYMVNDPLELNLNFPFQILYLGIIIVYTSMYYIVPIIKNYAKNKSKIASKQQANT